MVSHTFVWTGQWEPFIWLIFENFMWKFSACSRMIMYIPGKTIAKCSFNRSFSFSSMLWTHCDTLIDVIDGLQYKKKKHWFWTHWLNVNVFEQRWRKIFFSFKSVPGCWTANINLHWTTVTCCSVEIHSNYSDYLPTSVDKLNFSRALINFQIFSSVTRKVGRWDGDSNSCWSFRKSSDFGSSSNEQKQVPLWLLPKIETKQRR